MEPLQFAIDLLESTLFSFTNQENPNWEVINDLNAAIICLWDKQEALEGAKV